MKSSGLYRRSSYPRNTNHQQIQPSSPSQHQTAMLSCSQRTLFKLCLCFAAAATLVSLILLSGHDEHADNPQTSLKIPNDQIFQEDTNGKLNLIQTKFSEHNFQPDFSRSNGNSITIPHIIHQIWDNHNIPGIYHEWVKSWLEINPDWEYWIWTIDDGKALIEKYFPDFGVYFESYPSNIHRADVMRYFILYLYGGMYLDLDMLCLKPLSNWTYNYNCFVSEEPYHHSYIVRSQNFSNVVNGVLGCTKHHPFYKMLIDSLPEYAGRYFGDFLHATGPFFLQDIYIKYQQSHNATLHPLTVLPPKYFLPTFDPSEGDVISHKCLPERVKELSVSGQSLCRELMITSYNNKPGLEAFTDHFWVHANMFDDVWKKLNAKSIFQLVPMAKNVKDLLT